MTKFHQLLTIIFLASSVTVGLTVQPVEARSDRLCFTVPGEEDGISDFHVYAGDTFSDSLGPGRIHGQTLRTRVNVRCAPGIENPILNLDAFVGDPIEIVGFGYDRDCKQWMQIYFAGYQRSGWVYGQYVEPFYNRGLFD